MGSTEQKTLQTILQAIIDQGNLTVTEVNASVGSGTDSLEVVKNIKLQELAGAAGNHTITLEAKAQELVQYISEQGFRIRINQANHGFTFNPIQYDTGLAKYVKATKDNPADAMAIRVDNDNFDLVTSGSYPLSSGIKDVFGKDLVEDEYYFLDENVAGGFTPIKPIHIYQPLFLVAKDKGKLRALIEVETPTDLEPRILNDFFDEQVERVVNTADEKIEEIKTTQGLKGDKGDKGDTGAVGPQGIQGIQGVKGDKGDTGSQGLKGDKGDQGIQGIQGIKGDTGIQGPIGPQGDKGDKGEVGDLINVNSNMKFRDWMGTEDELNATFKEADTRYLTFGPDNKLTGGFFFENREPSKYYDPRISMIFDVNSVGIHHWQNPDDPMPIKTINMNGLQKWEETDDYIIYLDKDAVMTTVESYVTGTYDLFKERKADIDGAMELLKINDIEWTAEDDTKLILDINKAQLERIANTPTTMEEEDFIPQTFTTRAVPTTYECCFRIDKSSGEIYIGEGYENLSLNAFGTEWLNINGKNVFNQSVLGSNRWINVSYPVNAIKDEVCKFTELFEVEYSTSLKKHFGSQKFKFAGGDSSGSTDVKFEVHNHISSGNFESFLVSKSVIPTKTATGHPGNFGFISNLNYNSPDSPDIDFASGDFWFKVIKSQITKTSTPKPFVKSIMPSGKLAFVTGAHWDTHSFLIKKFRGFGKNFNGICRILNTDKGGVIIMDVRPLFVNNKMADAFVSNTQRVLVDEDYVKYANDNSSGTAVKNTFTLTAQPDKLHPDSFKQLLIYKGNLTEAELKAENEKDIRLK